MRHGENEPLFVFRKNSNYNLNDYSHDLYVDIERLDDTIFYAVDRNGKQYQLLKAEYRLFCNTDVQYVLVDCHYDQSRWLLVDHWKQRDHQDGAEIAFYDDIQEATAEAKRRNATTVHPTLEQTLERLRKIIQDVQKYQ